MDICPICEENECLTDEDWCHPCSEEFYTEVQQEDNTYSPKEKG